MNQARQATAAFSRIPSGARRGTGGRERSKGSEQSNKRCHLAALRCPSYVSDRVKRSTSETCMLCIVLLRTCNSSHRSVSLLWEPSVLHHVQVIKLSEPICEHLDPSGKQDPGSKRGLYLKVASRRASHHSRSLALQRPSPTDSRSMSVSNLRHRGCTFDPDVKEEQDLGANGPISAPLDDSVTTTKVSRSHSSSAIKSQSLHFDTVANSEASSGATPAPHSASSAQQHFPSPPSDKSDRKRRLSHTRLSSLGRPRPPPLTTKSSSAVPTLSTLQVESSITHSPTKALPSPRRWLGHSTAMTMNHSHALSHNHTAADMLRHMMHG